MDKGGSVIFFDEALEGPAIEVYDGYNSRIEGIGLIHGYNASAVIDCIGIKIGDYNATPALRREAVLFTMRNVWVLSFEVGIWVHDTYLAVMENVRCQSNRVGMRVGVGAVGGASGMVFKSCSFQGSYGYPESEIVRCELLIENGQNLAFEDCQVNTDNYNTRASILIQGGETMAFKNLHLERWMPTESGSFVVIEKGFTLPPRCVSFEESGFAGNCASNCHELEIGEALFTRFERCLTLEDPNAPRKIYHIASAARFTAIKSPIVLDTNRNLISLDKVMSEKIIDEGQSTVIDIPGHALQRPDHIIGLADGAISSAGFGAYPQANLALASFLFDNEGVWDQQYVTVTPVPIGDILC